MSYMGAVLLGETRKGIRKREEGRGMICQGCGIWRALGFSSVLWGTLEGNCIATLHPTFRRGSGAFVPFSLLVISHRIQGKGRASMVQLQALLHKKVQEAQDNPHG